MHDIDDELAQLECDVSQILRDHSKSGVLSKWEHAREERTKQLEVLDQQAICGCQTKSTEMETTVQKISEALTALASLNDEMQKLETEIFGVQPDEKRLALAEQLHRLRQQRVQRPRLLCSLSVSSRTGGGLDGARRALVALMEDKRLFPLMGMQVPLNYSMLERLAQQGSVRGSQSAGDESMEVDQEIEKRRHLIVPRGKWR